MKQATLTTTRLAAGKYLTNERYELRLRSRGAGGLYDNGPAWYWYDTATGAKMAGYFDTKRQALTALRVYLSTGGV